MEFRKLNRIKAVLRQEGRTNIWLSSKISKNKVTVSRWCRNVQQPDLETLFRIAEILDVHVYELLEVEPPRREEQ